MERRHSFGHEPTEPHSATRAAVVARASAKRGSPRTSARGGEPSIQSRFVNGSRRLRRCARATPPRPRRARSSPPRSRASSRGAAATPKGRGAWRRSPEPWVRARRTRWRASGPRRRPTRRPSWPRRWCLLLEGRAPCRSTTRRAASWRPSLRARLLGSQPARGALAPVPRRPPSRPSRCVRRRRPDGAGRCARRGRGGADPP